MCDHVWRVLLLLMTMTMMWRWRLHHCMGRHASRWWHAATKRLLLAMLVHHVGTTVLVCTKASLCLVSRFESAKVVELQTSNVP